MLSLENESYQPYNLGDMTVSAESTCAATWSYALSRSITSSEISKFEKTS